MRQIGYALKRLTEPLLGPIRRFLPDLGGLDISPIVLLLGLQFLEYAHRLLQHGHVSGPFRPGRGGQLLALRVTPRASRNGISGLHTAGDGQVSLALKVTAVPDKGRANQAVIEVLAKAAGLPKSAFSIVSGETDRNKTVLVAGNIRGA